VQNSDKYFNYKMTNIISSADLIINEDGSVFHLKLLPGDIANNILLVGDQGRVDLIAQYFDNVEFEKQNREFKTITGSIRGERITVISTGIGTDNIDIVVNELDALVNIDFSTRQIKPKHHSLNLIRIGTSGALHQSIVAGTFLLSEFSLGLDGLLNFYEIEYTNKEKKLRSAFLENIVFPENLATPYAISCTIELADKFRNFTTNGITLTAPGFYAPQGRQVKFQRLYPNFNNQFRKFNFEGLNVVNYEMESSALYGLSRILGHKALTICLAIANRENNTAVSDYQSKMKEMIEKILCAL
jgi:uridine phosphorylase